MFSAHKQEDNTMNNNKFLTDKMNTKYFHEVGDCKSKKQIKVILKPISPAVILVILHP